MDESRGVGTIQGTWAADGPAGRCKDRASRGISHSILPWGSSVNVRVRVYNDKAGRGYSGDTAPDPAGRTEEIWEVASMAEALDRAKAYYAQHVEAVPWQGGYMVRMDARGLWFLTVQEEAG